MANSYSISFGALADPIQHQLERQGFALDLDTDQVDRLQMCADSIARLKIQSLLTEAEGDRVRNRLMKRITKHVVRRDAQAAAERLMGGAA
jgi:hypothetical protein